MTAALPGTVPLRAALYLRVSTARQAEHDVSIPDQRKQGEAYCAARGYQLVETFVDAGASATNDRRPEFQQMIEAGTAKPAPFEVVVVHSFSRFFRDHFELEFYVRKLAKNGIRLLSITQEMGDDPMHVMMRQIMALFDEYQSKENAKHVLRALKENARQGFWNGSLPPIGYRVVAAEQRGAKTKKKLEIDPIHAETVRLAFRLAMEGDGTSGPMGVKTITKHLNEHRIFTRDGERWGIGTVHRLLTRKTYIGRHVQSRHQERRQQARRGDHPRRGAADHRPGGVRRCADPHEGPQPQGDAAAGCWRPHAADRSNPLRQVRRGDDDPYRQRRALPLLHMLDQGPAGTVRLHRHDRADGEAGRAGRRASGGPIARPGAVGRGAGDGPCRRQERTERRRDHIAELNKRGTETDLRLKRLYDAIESGVADLDDPDLKDRIASLKAIRDQSRVDAERASAMLESVGQKAITAPMLAKFAQTARQRMRLPGGGYRRDHLRALAQRVEVNDGEVRIMGSKSDLLRTLAAAGGSGTLQGAVPSFVPKWRSGRDSNPR